MWSWARLCKLVSLKFLFPLLNAKYHFVSIYTANIIVTQHKQQIAQNSIFSATIYRYRGKKSERSGAGAGKRDLILSTYRQHYSHCLPPPPAVSRSILFVSLGLTFDICTIRSKLFVSGASFFPNTYLAWKLNICEAPGLLCPLPLRQMPN